jgi:hypothetical protein
MIATPVDALPKGMLPRPELRASDNAVWRALEHMRGLREAYAQMRANELDKIKRGLVVVVKIAPATRNNWHHSRTKFDALMK